jgi:DNA-dependent metalloprotease WSS1
MSRRIHSLHELDRVEGHDAFIPSKNQVATAMTMAMAHMPSLSQADHAASLLQRIHREFFPIVQRRGYSVLSVSEMCCCGDGLDAAAGGRKKRRPQPHNILGYNQTRFGRTNTHTIHLRLRQPTNHRVFYDYDDIAGTMSHELAHCEVSPHSAKFYRLMDEIQEQHAVFMVRGIVADRAGFPMNSAQSHTLGGGRSNGSAAAAALARQRTRAPWMPQGPQPLGGASKPLLKFMTPGEAAGNAAEERRRADEVWCMPCEPEIIELSDDENEIGKRLVAVTKLRGDGSNKKDLEEKVNQDNDDDRKMPARKSQTSPIDLTLDDDEHHLPPPKQPRLAFPLQHHHCPLCTFINAPLALSCAICANELVSSTGAIQQLVRNDAIETCKAAEVEKSKAQFGFNIYGNDHQVSNQMKHLT